MSGSLVDEEEEVDEEKEGYSDIEVPKYRVSPTIGISKDWI